VLNESAERLHIDPSRDWITIQSRFKHEGESFLTITLPAMEAALLESIASSSWVPNRLWKQSRKGGPEFLREFLGLVFDYGVAGVPILENPSAEALRCIRQILLLNGKVRVLPTPERSARAIEGFLETERELRHSRKSILAAYDDEFNLVVNVLYGELFQKSQKDLEFSFHPKHGPGQTAESSFGLRKYDTLMKSWTCRLDKAFSVVDHAFYSYGDAADMTEGRYDSTLTSPSSETPMRITLVPKTAKTPRIIAMEPTSLQWIQQGILRSLDSNIQSLPYLRASLSWRDQNRNRLLAQKASLDRSFATLDLSEASDRLHVSVVSKMLRNYPVLRRAVLASRSRQASFEGRLIQLEKFAPMGSAMCFAFETLAFAAMATLAVLRTRNTRLTRGSILRSLSQISVFGDDIIVPSDCAGGVVACLESFGLKINRRKSFWRGYFRESCGAEFFRGYDVSVVRLREKFSNYPSQPSELLSWSSSQNQFFNKGWYMVSGKMITHHLPVLTSEPESGLFYLAWAEKASTRWNRDLQRTEVRVSSPKYRSTVAGGLDRNALFHWFVTKSDVPSEHDIIHSVGRPKLVGLRSTFVAR